MQVQDQALQGWRGRRCQVYSQILHKDGVGSATRVRKPPLSRAMPTEASSWFRGRLQLQLNVAMATGGLTPTRPPAARSQQGLLLPGGGGEEVGRWGSPTRLATGLREGACASAHISSHKSGHPRSPPCPESGSPENRVQGASATGAPLRGEGQAGLSSGRSTDKPGPQPCLRKEVVAIGGRGHPRTQAWQLAGGYAAAPKCHLVLPSTLCSGQHEAG